MFRKPVDEAKQSILNLSIELINNQSKAVLHALEIIESELRRLDTNSAQDLELINSLASIRDINLADAIEDLVRCRNQILSASIPEDMVNHSKLNKLPKNFFASQTVQRVDETNKKLQDARVNLRKMIAWRQNLIAGALVTTYLTSTIGLYVIGTVVAISVNPIVGFAMIGLAIGLYIYAASQFEKTSQYLFNRLTAFNEPVATNHLTHASFPELNKLLDCDYIKKLKHISKKTAPTYNHLPTLGDGNCAFNAVAQFIHALVTQNQYFEPQLVGYHSIDDLKQALQGKHSNNIQKLLSPKLRNIVVDYINAHHNEYQASLLDKINLAIDFYFNNPESEDIPHADAFLIHPFFKTQWDQIAASANNNAEFKSQIKKWWETQGFQRYLAEISQPAASSGDIARWGAELELDVLAKACQFQIRCGTSTGGSVLLGNSASPKICLLQNEGGHWTYVGMDIEETSALSCAVR